MAYIPLRDREKLNKPFNKLAKIMLKIKHLSAGDLNYLITKLCLVYSDRERETYHNLNDVMGVLDCVSKEFYRRKFVKFCKSKKNLNGDVY